MTDEELIKAALILKEEEDSALKQFLKDAGFAFVGILFVQILLAEESLEEIFQQDFEEILAIVAGLLLVFPDKMPPEKKIRKQLNQRSFVKNMKENVLPVLKDTLSSIFEAFKDKYEGTADFNKRRKSSRDIDKWLKELPKVMKLTTDDAVVRLIRKSYEEEKGIEWLEEQLANLPEFSHSRARTTAITENLRMHSAGDYEAYFTNKDIYGSKWCHSSVPKEPRQAHIAAHGQIVKKGDYFVVNGHKCRYPRDPMLPASESIHCHCYPEPVGYEEFKEWESMQNG